MKKFLLLLFAVVIVISCDDESTNIRSCGIEATVRDLTGLDGCGFVFELKDGSRLEPLRLFFCGTPPLPKEVTEDPLYNFEFVDGKKVRIGYEEMQSPSICMVGKTVKITCLEEIESPNEK